MKNHLKALASPPAWKIDRKKNKFIVRPSPGPHPLAFSLPLGLVIRDFLQYARTMREVKKMLNHQPVLVDGQRRKDPRFPLGLFDVLSFPSLPEDFRLLLDSKGRIAVKKINPSQSRLKPCRIEGKTSLSQGLQLNLHDGKNLLVDRQFPGRVGDTVLLTLPDQKIKEIFELKKGAFVFLTRGKRSGCSGLLQEIKKDQAVYQSKGKNIETLKRYLFVLGDEKSAQDLGLIQNG